MKKDGLIDSAKFFEAINEHREIASQKISQGKEEYLNFLIKEMDLLDKKFKNSDNTNVINFKPAKKTKNSKGGN